MRQALILAAGEGTRLRPLTLDRPKPMLAVGGVPVLERQILLLRRHGICDIAINVCYHGEVIQRHVGDGARWGVQVAYLVEPALLGSAGTLLRLRDHFTGTFVALYGDLYTDADISALAAFHAQHRAVCTLALHHAEEPTREGIVAIDPTSGRVTQFVEKPTQHEVFSRMANAGIFVMEPAALDVLPRDRHPLDIGHDLLPALLAEGVAVYGTQLHGFVLDIGSPERYRQADAHASAHSATTSLAVPWRRSRVGCPAAPRLKRGFHAPIRFSLPRHAGHRSGR